MNEAASPIPRLATPSDDQATMNNNDCYVVGWGRNSWGGNPCVHVYSPAKEACINQQFLFVCFVALRLKSRAMVMAGWSVHLTTLFPGQA